MEFEFCHDKNNKEQYKRLFQFFQDHRNDLDYPISDERFVALINQIYEFGGGLIAMQKGEIVGGAGFVLGSAEYGYENRDTATIHPLILAAHLRRTRFFAKGFYRLGQELHKLNVKEVIFTVNLSNPFYHKMYSKFARPTHQYSHESGIKFDLYKTSMGTFLEKTAPFQRYF